MNLVCDEGVDRPIVDALREAGHEVVYVAELSPSIADDEVLATANSQNALLVTLDKDFGELVFRQRRVTAGVLLLRLAGLTAPEKCRIAVAVLDTHGSELQASFTVVTPRKVRIRHPNR